MNIKTNDIDINHPTPEQGRWGKLQELAQINRRLAREEWVPPSHPLDKPTLFLTVLPSPAKVPTQTATNNRRSAHPTDSSTESLVICMCFMKVIMENTNIVHNLDSLLMAMVDLGANIHLCWHYC